MKLSSILLSTPLLAVVFVGCTTSPDDVCLADRRLAANRLAANQLVANRLAANSLLTAALPEVPLTSGSIAEAVPPEVFADAFAESVFEYMVGCALEPGQSVEVDVGGELRTYEGALGLAPQWGAADGECDASCKGWVSACLIARTNFKGESVEISLLGDNPGLDASAEESFDFDVEEATYFGDLFGANKSMYACVPQGSTGPLRTCGEHPADCPITVIGECDASCDETGCRDPHGVVHGQSITVNVRDAAASCE
jgi:hypothetical protein